MRAIVTCGPSFEPIDEVRRLTNFSTSELGTLLATALARAGCETVCLRGVGATWPAHPTGAEVRPFTTNDDLATQLHQLSRTAPYDLLFHTAALADYRVATIQNAGGHLLTSTKIATSQGPLTLHLEPATKLLPQLRAWFPTTHLIGWKYELEGSLPQALARAQKQMADCQTDACVLNGRAYGPGFALIHPNGQIIPLASKESLCAHLVENYCAKNRKISCATIPIN